MKYYRVMMSKDGTKFSASTTFPISADNVYDAERKAQQKHPNLKIVSIEEEK